MEIYVLFFHDEDSGCAVNINAYSTFQKALDDLPNSFESDEKILFRRYNSEHDLIIQTNYGSFLIQKLKVK